MNIPDLVERACGTGEDAAVAAELLVAVGAAALPAIVEAMRDPWSDTGKLFDVLTSIYSEVDVGTLVDALGSRQLQVFQAALRTLGERADEQSRNVLLERLQNPRELPSRRADIARVCGESGDPNGVSVLQAVLEESLSSPGTAEVPPVLTVESAVALAKLGDFSAGVHVVAFLGDDFPPTAALAAEALKIAVGAGMIGALAQTVEGPSPEARIAAIDPLFLLGVPAAAAVLAHGLRSDDPDVRHNCRVRLNDVLGTTFSDSDRELGSLEVHAAETLATWDESTRYRAGVPFFVGTLAELVRPGNPRNGEIAQEILLATGWHVDVSDQFDADIELGERFPQRGTLYRWGHAVSAHLLMG
ncbi:HEAT repeat domain-containing protein [Streptomyces sp. NPDC059568]|uniref:HEAT repeat domain-containing protein n=1 Tax=Streptomyces sp. NPDC059568 TaxID=3346868 RepID=UPI00369AEBAF